MTCPFMLSGLGLTLERESGQAVGMSMASAGGESGIAEKRTHWVGEKVRVNWAFSILEAFLWFWSIAVCVPFWRNDPNYAYGWVVPFLMFFFLWRRLGAQDAAFWERCGLEGRETIRVHPWLLALVAVVLFPLEVYRLEYYQSGIVLWGINMAKVAFSLMGAWWLGGRRLVVLTLFPILFFLTAVPWPAKIAQPLQQNLMIGVANVVTEVLLWLAIPVRLEGAVLYLSKGTVGIVEACSGIRSLQSGLMISLAVGEFYWLSRSRRGVVVGVAILLALLSNLGRTLALCLIMERQGAEAMHEAHDMVGNIAMYSLYALIWGLAWFFSLGGTDIWPTRKAGTWGERISRLSWEHVPNFKPLLIGSVLVFVTIQVWYEVLRWRANPQKEPQFSALLEETPGLTVLEWEPEVWAYLLADRGDRFEVKVSDAPLGYISASHLFWLPSERSKWAMVHRPDACMPGTGWKSTGPVTEISVEIDGYTLPFLVFDFEREDVRGLQVWGAWRNGEPIDFDYGNRIAANPERYGMFPSDRHMRSVEVVSLFIPYKEGKPPVEVARRQLERLFRFKPHLRPNSESETSMNLSEAATEKTQN